MGDRCQNGKTGTFSRCDYQLIVGGYTCPSESLSVEDDYLICKGDIIIFNHYLYYLNRKNHFHLVDRYTLDSNTKGNKLKVIVRLGSNFQSNAGEVEIGSGVGAIIGAVVGVSAQFFVEYKFDNRIISASLFNGQVVVVTLLLVGIVIYIRRRKKKNKQSNMNSQGGTDSVKYSRYYYLAVFGRIAMMSL